MMDSQVPVSRVVAAAMWGLVIALIVAAWVLLVIGHDDVALMLGLTACATSAGAATAHIRCYAIRLSALFKDTSAIRQGSHIGSISSMR